jgi:hypothetical protein
MTEPQINNILNSIQIIKENKDKSVKINITKSYYTHI